MNRNSGGKAKLGVSLGDSTTDFLDFSRFMIDDAENDEHDDVETASSPMRELQRVSVETTSWQGRRRAWSLEQHRLSLEKKQNLVGLGSTKLGGNRKSVDDDTILSKEHTIMTQQTRTLAEDKMLKTLTIKRSLTDSPSYNLPAPASSTAKSSKANTVKRASTDLSFRELPKQDRRIFKRTLVEVFPGQQVELRGSEESWHAFENDCVVQTSCYACETFLYCIDSAHLVICPSCRSISPIDNATEQGLGMGLTVDFVSEQLQRRNQR